MKYFSFLIKFKLELDADERRVVRAKVVGAIENWPQSCLMVYCTWPQGPSARPLLPPAPDPCTSSSQSEWEEFLKGQCHE